jgi:hypothetical protein
MTAIYVSGIPHMGYADLKQILGGSPIGIQLRHIGNLCWIEKRILEILVDVNNAQRMRKRIGKYSDYHVKTRFDPLSPHSFNWEEGIRPDSKIRILQTNLVSRLATSLASTNVTYSRQCIVDFVRNRGLGQQFEGELQKQGIVVTSPTEHDQSPQAGPSSVGPGLYMFTSKSNETCRKGVAAKYAKRKLSISSDNYGER